MDAPRGCKKRILWAPLIAIQFMPPLSRICFCFFALKCGANAVKTTRQQHAGSCKGCFMHVCNHHCVFLTCTWLTSVISLHLCCHIIIYLISQAESSFEPREKVTQDILFKVFATLSLSFFFLLLFWHLCCIAITFTPALSSFQLTVDLLWWVQGPTPPLYLLCEFEWNQVILSFCEVFKLHAVYYLND